MLILKIKFYKFTPSFIQISLRRIVKNFYLSPERSKRRAIQLRKVTRFTLRVKSSPSRKKKYPRNINSIVQHCQRHSSPPYPSTLPLLFSSVCKDSARTKKRKERKKKKNWYFRLASLVINLRHEGRETATFPFAEAAFSKGRER